MASPSATNGAAVRPGDRHGDSLHQAAEARRLRGRGRSLARAGWVAVLLLQFGLFAAALPAYAAALRTVCIAAPCASWRLTPESERALAERGLSVDLFAAYSLAQLGLYTAVYYAIAALLVWRQPAERLARYAALTLVLVGNLAPNARAALDAASPMWGRVSHLSASLGWASFFTLFFYLFPDGRFVPRWTRWLAVAWYAANLPSALAQTRFPPPTWPPLLSVPLILGLFGSGVFAQLYRYRRVSGPTQRQQTKWVVSALTVAVVVFAVSVFLPAFAPPSSPQLLRDIVGDSLLTVGFLLIPLSLGLAILKYRLWDIDVIVNRTLVYGALTASVVGTYALVVGGLGALLQARGNLAISLLATGLVAVLFQPLRERLQRGANRLLYGERDEPYAVLSRLGQRLEGALVPDAVLPTIVQTVREALKLPYAAIALRQDGGLAVVAAAGAPVGDLLRLPLVYQHEAVGELLLAPRAPGEAFGPADRRLLDDLARQAGVATQAVRLTADLRRSRERLVAAREEERRRLRRDLHDGLGPTLGAQMLKVGSARALYAHDPAAADALLADLEGDLDAALADIRRLVYALRPPALDELGLVGAIRQSAAQYGGRGGHAGGANGDGLRIEVVAPERLPPLPAAVEVAAYRIAQEALTNAVRHAHARTCQIRLSLDDEELRVVVADDGVGLPDPRAGSPRHTGVGLVSMRERAEELGGTCQVETRPEGGTRVLACLPLPQGPAQRAGAPTAENGVRSAMEATDSLAIGTRWTSPCAS